MEARRQAWPKRIVLGVVSAASIALSAPAHAQYTPAPSSSPAPSASSMPLVPPAPSASAASPAKPPKPDPGPALREGGGRRRRANPASGAFFALAIASVLVYWIVKRLRR